MRLRPHILKHFFYYLIHQVLMSLEMILKKIDDSRDDIVRDLMDMIRIPSIGPANGGEGEGKRADYLMTLLKGFDEVRRIDVDDDDYPGIKRPSILAVKKGKRKGTVWIVAHTDTVLPGDPALWKYPPFEPHLEDGKVYGLGAEDNGQAVIASIYASKFFDGELKGRSIGIALVADEETTSEMGIGYLVRNGFFTNDDVILVPDWGSPGSSMVDIAEKHLLWVKVSVKGKQTHGSTPSKGLNAYRIGSKFMTDLLEELDKRYGKTNDLFKPPVSTFEPTKSSGTVGTVNTIPGYYEFWMDCRILTDYDPNEILGFMRTFAETESERTGAVITVDKEQMTFSGPASSVDSDEYHALCESIKDITGIEVKAAGIGGGTCANFFRLDGLNAYVWESEGGSLHQPNEFVRIDSIMTDAKVYAALFYRLCAD